MTKILNPRSSNTKIAKLIKFKKDLINFEKFVKKNPELNFKKRLAKLTFMSD